MGKPVLPNIQSLIQAGINPKTGLPIKFECDAELKNNIKRQLRIKHEQQYRQRFTWYGLPDNIDGELIERMLFYRGSLMFFYIESTDSFYVLPYTLDATDGTGIDVYGRYTEVTPIPFAGQADGPKKDKDRPWIAGLTRKPIYTIKQEIPEWKDITEKCVILNDYTKQMSNVILPRAVLDDSILDVEAELIPFFRTTLQNETGLTAVRVNNQDEYSNVLALNDTVNVGALTGKRYIPVIGAVDFQELGEGKSMVVSEYMQALESIDNYRLSLLGIDQPGVFQKSQYINNQSQSLSAGSNGLILEDALEQRQNFCAIVNSLFGLNIWCMPSESLVGDLNGDGMILDSQDQSGATQGAQPAQTGGSNNE